MAEPGPIIVDTDVFSAVFTTSRERTLRRGHPLARWEAALTGRRPVISFQTRAESLSGAYRANWGEKRLADLIAQLQLTPTVEADRDVVEAYARLSSSTASIGHPLGHKQQTPDRWVAACAIAKAVPLLTGNLRHFRGAPRLELVAY